MSKKGKRKNEPKPAEPKPAEAEQAEEADAAEAGDADLEERDATKKREVKKSASATADDADVDEHDDADEDAPHSADEEEDDEAYTKRDSSVPPPARSIPPKSGFRKSLLIAMGVVLTVLVVIFVVRRVRESDEAVKLPTPATPLSAIPDGAFVVATLDLEALRKEPLSAPFLSGEREIPGLGPMRTTCGFDPLAMVDRVAVGIPDSPNNDFGVVAMGRLSNDPILECARKIIAGRGGTPVSADVGRFKTVRDGADAGSGEIAIGDTGHLLFGGGTYLRAMMQAAEQKAPDASKSATHTALRASLAGHEHVQASLVLSPLQRKTVEQELAQSKGSGPSAVRHIVGAALGIKFAGNEAQVLFVLRSESAEFVTPVADLLAETLQSAASGPAVRVIGASEVLERVRLETQGENVRALVTITGKELLEIAEKANRLSALVNAMETKTPVLPPAE